MGKLKLSLTIILAFFLAFVASGHFFNLHHQTIETVPSDDNQQVSVDDTNQATEQLPPGEPEDTNPNPIIINNLVLLDVPFTSQAPFGEWDEPRHQDACEESSILMAYYWLTNKKFPDKGTVKDEIRAITYFEDDFFGYFEDTSALDTARLMQAYYGITGIRSETDISINDIKQELLLGNLVLVPADGRKLGNPNYTAPGPERHMLVIKGYDPSSQEFITNDAGTRNGENYRYTDNILASALRDYPSGIHQPITETVASMIVVEK